MKSKIILFGGTFDPIHSGHVKVAEFAFDYIGGDELVFVVAKRSPHKCVFPSVEGSFRLEMVDLAVAGKDNFRVSDCELHRGDPSYTIDTVSSFIEEYGPDTDFYWLVGADMVKDLPRWHEVDQLLDLCNVCVMYRGGFGEPDFSEFSGLGAERVEKLKKNVICTPLIDVSSTEVRTKLACGEDLRGVLCPPVLEFIEKNGLYR